MDTDERQGQKIFEGEKWIVEAVQEDYSQRARILTAKI